MRKPPPPHILTQEERSRAGKRSQEVRAAKKSMQETAKALLGMKIGIILPQEADVAKLAQWIKPDMTVKQAILVAQTVKAVSMMDTQAAVFVRDTAGEKPSDKVNVEANVSYVEMLKQAKGDDM